MLKNWLKGRLVSATAWSIDGISGLNSFFTPKNTQNVFAVMYSHKFRSTNFRK